VPATLTLRGVDKRRIGRDRAFELRIETLRLLPGTMLALTGPSGCGKSTAADLCGLALQPDEADLLRLEGDGGDFDIAAMWRSGRHEALARLRARYFGYVPQTGALLPFLTVGGNIALAQQLAGRRDPTRVDDLARHLGIAELKRELPERLSVGQRQRVAIARALAHAPDFVIADEPTASLDPDNARLVMGLLVSSTREAGGALLVVAHDLDLVAELALPRATLATEALSQGWRTVLGAPA
jgi:putative ABC transport system ATP-binding protein